MTSSALPDAPTQLFIGGSWRDASAGATFAVENPADGSTLVEVANGTVEDGKAAIDAAVAAQPDWAKVPPRDRGEILRSAFETVVDRADELATIMTLEMGKPL
ncbi:MAG: aldehyde dehydrogenase family protein, partial [Aeromicrobium erythreum]